MNQSEKFWNRISGLYARTPIKDESCFRETIVKIKQYLKQDDIVLDFGCGTGTNSIEIAGSVKEIHAVDISKGMLAIARSRTDERKIDNIFYHQTSLFDECFNTRSFNVILGFNIFHILEDLPKIIQRMYGLLSPNGVLISVTPCLSEKKSFVTLLMLLLGKAGLAPKLNMFKYSELSGLLATEKLELIESEKIEKNSSEYFVVVRRID